LGTVARATNLECATRARGRRERRERRERARAHFHRHSTPRSRQSHRAVTAQPSSELVLECLCTPTVASRARRAP